VVFDVQSTHLFQFLPNAKDKHLMSEEHQRVLSCGLNSVLLHYETAQDQRLINPDSKNELSAANRSLTVPAAAMERVTDIAQEAIQLLQLEVFTAAVVQNDNPSKSSLLINDCYSTRSISL
jgi:hypothetical protein